VIRKPLWAVGGAVVLCLAVAAKQGGEASRSAPMTRSQLAGVRPPARTASHPPATQQLRHCAWPLDDVVASPNGKVMGRMTPRGQIARGPVALAIRGDNLVVGGGANTRLRKGQPGVRVRWCRGKTLDISFPVCGGEVGQGTVATTDRKGVAVVRSDPHPLRAVGC
jgi:hypothetical protein